MGPLLPCPLGSHGPWSLALSEALSPWVMAVSRSLSLWGGCFLREGCGWGCIWVCSIAVQKAWDRAGKVFMARPELLLACLSFLASSFYLHPREHWAQAGNCCRGTWWLRTEAAWFRSWDLVV